MKIGAHEYQIGKLDPKRQFHVVRRIAPLMVQASAGDMPAVLQALAAMSDVDVDYVLDTCLAVVARKQETAGGVVYAPVQPRPGQIMFSDLQASDLLEISMAVIQDSLGNFFTIAQSVSEATPK